MDYFTPSFHTIKSILNLGRLAERDNSKKSFHTIKSILIMP